MRISLDSIALPLRETVEGVLPPVGVVAVPEPIAPRKSALRCECCECKLAPDGSVMEYSDKAREMRERGDTIRKHVETIAARDQDITRLKTENASLREPAAKRARVTLPGE